MVAEVEGQVVVRRGRRGDRAHPRPQHGQRLGRPHLQRRDPCTRTGAAGLAAACTDDLLRWFERDTDVTRVDLFATRAGAPIYAARGFTVRGFPAMCLPVAPLTGHWSRVENTPLPVAGSGVFSAVVGLRRQLSFSSSSRMVAVCCTWVRNS